MSWSKRRLAWKDETSLPVANGLYYNPLTRTREPRRKPHNKYDRMHVREHIPVKPIIIFHGCYGDHSPWDHPRFSGMSSYNSVGSFSSQISTYELIEGRMYWDSLTSFWSCSYGIFQKTLNFILSELMIIFSLCSPLPRNTYWEKPTWDRKEKYFSCQEATLYFDQIWKNACWMQFQGERELNPTRPSSRG